MHVKKLTIAAAAIGAVLLATLTSGCSQVADKLDSGEDTSSAAVTTSTTLIQTSQWGVVDGLLSIQVVNTSDRILRYGQAVIRGLDADGDVVASSSEMGDAGCCSLVDVPPGDKYGIYLDIGARADRVREVAVTYRNISWAPADAELSIQDVSAAPVDIKDGPSGAVAVARLTSSEKHGQVGVQAFLTDPDGKLVAVVSGRWTCLGTGPREIRLQLFHPVPADTTFSEVRVHALDADPTSQAPACDGSGQK